MKIKILQWNVWYKDSINNLDKIIREIKKIDADIVCLQELSKNKNERDGLDKLFKSYKHGYYAVADRFQTRDQGNAILTKFPIVNRETVYVNDPGEATNGYDKEGRVYIEITVNAEGKNLTVGTTQSSYTDKFVETIGKSEEVGRLVDIITEKKDNYIFTGDLNTPPNSFYIANIRNYLKNLGPALTHPTWPTKPFIYRDFKEDNLKWRLDYVFGTKDIKVVKAEILETKVSDHLPILVEIEL